ncbi:MAG: hypothetical protein D6732_07970 [Methanobacteriota archaeon]|nr:MAG: hypothetical protein D6732_07970 [Euryarchaeota archaeon]
MYGHHTKPIVCFDIETVALEPDPEEFEASYMPPRNYKDPEKIKEHKEKAYKEWVEKQQFKRDGAKIISIAWGLVEETPTLKHVSGMCSDNEVDPLRAFTVFLGDLGTYKLMGFNINSFDLPILSVRLAKYGLHLPGKVAKWDAIDLFEWPLQRSMGLKKACRVYNVENRLKMDGADVAELYANRKLAEIEDYNRNDVFVTIGLYNALSRTYQI